MSQYQICERVMNSLFEDLVQRSTNFDTDEGLHFRIRISGDNFGYEKDGHTFHEEWVRYDGVYVNILMIKPFSVFMSTSTSHEDVPFEEYENLSNHDSCWRNAVHLSRIAFKIWDRIYVSTPKEHRPETKDQSIDYDMAPLSYSLFRAVKVDYKTDDEDYKKHLTKIVYLDKNLGRLI